MAADKQKEITMVLNVDLDCERCNKKIRIVLRKIREKMKIKTIWFGEKRKVVTISGPFDAEKVRRKLCCEAGRIIKSIDVMEEDKDEDDEDEDEDEDGEERKTVVVPAVDEIKLHRLREKMLELERPKARPQPAPCKCSCGCTCSKQTTWPPAQGTAMPSVWPAPASSVSGHGYEAPSPYYGVPVYNIEGWY